MARLFAPLLGACLLAAALPASADPPALALPVAALPQPSFATAAVWTGDAALVFGGAEMVCYCELDQVVRFDPGTRSTTLLDQTLPRPHAWGAAVWTGTEAIVFGGPRVVHVADSGEVTAEIDVPRSWFTPAAVYDGRYAYLFGAGPDDETLRYDPVNRTAALLDAVPPTPLKFAPAAWVDRAVFLFGGWDGDGYSDRIVRYDPGEDRFALLDARLPTPRVSAGAFSDGRYAYIVGGLTEPVDAPVLNGPVTHLDEIVRFDPRSGSIDVLPLRLGVGVADAAVVWTGSAAYVFGGTCECAPRFGPEHVSEDPFAMTNQLGASWMETDAILRLVP